MCTFSRTRIIVGFITLTLLFSERVLAVCAPGSEHCDPSVDDARAKVEQLLDSAFVTPHRLISLEKFDGRLLATQDGKMYEMRILAVLNYSGDVLECRINGCPELHNYLVEIDRRAKKAKVAGWLFLSRPSKDGDRQLGPLSTPRLRFVATATLR